MSGTSIFQKESSFKRYVRGFNLFIGFFAATKFHFMHAIVVEVKHNIYLSARAWFSTLFCSMKNMG